MFNYDSFLLPLTRYHKIPYRYSDRHRDKPHQSSVDPARPHFISQLQNGHTNVTRELLLYGAHADRADKNRFTRAGEWEDITVLKEC
jgi:hypothetical protein